MFRGPCFTPKFSSEANLCDLAFRSQRSILMYAMRSCKNKHQLIAGFEVTEIDDEERKKLANANCRKATELLRSYDDKDVTWEEKRKGQFSKTINNGIDSKDSVLKIGAKNLIDTVRNVYRLAPNGTYENLLTKTIGSPDRGSTSPLKQPAPHVSGRYRRDTEGGFGLESWRARDFKRGVSALQLLITSARSIYSHPLSL